MKKSQIKKVGDLEINQTFKYDGVTCWITSFPTRTSLVLINFRPSLSRGWSRCKITIREFKETAKRLPDRPLPWKEGEKAQW